MKRELIYQFFLLVIIACIVFIVISATQANLQALGVETGIDFLWKRAGFEIGQSLISYDANSSIARAFLVALLNTLLLAFTCIICASVLGLLIGVSRLSSNWLVTHLAGAYVELFRNIPALLQIFFWYFVVLRSMPRVQDSYSYLDMFYLNNRGFFFPAPQAGSAGTWMALAVTAVLLIFLIPGRRRKIISQVSIPAKSVFNTGILIVCGLLALLAVFAGLDWEIPQAGRFSYQGGFVLMPEFIALVVGLSMYNATYISEIVRSSFNSIPYGQTEAAQSLGLSKQLSLQLVVLPQAIRIMIPPLTTVYLNLFKSTSLAAAIAYPELISVFVGTVNNLVGQPVVIMSITLAVYAFISLGIALFLNWYDGRIALTTENER